MGIYLTGAPDVARGSAREMRAASAMKDTLSRSSLFAASMVLALGCATSSPTAANDTTVAGIYEEQAESIAGHLAQFDDVDFNVFTGQRWTDLHKTHVQNVVVHWPDGHTTSGLDKHIEVLKAMFVWAPDTRIKVHLIKVGQADWTGVVGVMEGTFTQPMPTPDGKSIPPTGKAYKLTIATFAHWTAAGSIDEEYLFWDNRELMREIGLE